MSDASYIPYELTLNEQQAQLAEIDENLIRNELTALERSEQLARRKDIYEVLHPQTKAGQAQALGMNKAKGVSVNAETAPTFAESTAIKTNLSKRTIQEDVQIAKRIAEPVRNIIRDTPIADNKSELLTLAPETALKSIYLSDASYINLHQWHHYREGLRLLIHLRSLNCSGRQ